MKENEKKLKPIGIREYSAAELLPSKFHANFSMANSNLDTYKQEGPRNVVLV